MRTVTGPVLLLSFIMALVMPGVASPALAEAQVPLGHVEIRGSGPVPMVLIAGPTLDWRYWSDFMDRNGEAYTMYAVTLPGVAGSTSMPIPPLWRPVDREARENPPLGTPWFDNAVDAIVDMMIEQETGRAVVMGHSMGGLLAVRLGIEHPQMVSAVVTLDGAISYPKTRAHSRKGRARAAQLKFDRNSRGISPEDWPDYINKWTRVGSLSPETIEFIHRVGAETEQAVCTRYFVEQRMTDLTQEIAELRVPLLGIFSRKDTDPGARSIRRTKLQFGPAWHEELLFYDLDDISYFYTLKEPKRFDADIARFIEAQNLAGDAADPDTDPDADPNPADH